MKNSSPTQSTKKIIPNFALSNNDILPPTTTTSKNRDYENASVNFKLKDSINNSITSSTTSNASSTRTNASNSASEKSFDHSNWPYATSILLATSSKQPIHLKQFDPLPAITLTTPTYENIPNAINEFIPLILQPSTEIISPKKEAATSESSFKPIDFENDEARSADIMIYLNLKETPNNLDFSSGFRNFIATHYRENANNYSEQIRQFNYFRESTIRLSYEPGNDSIHRLFEYFNSLCLTEKRFFQYSQCALIHFTWYDCINGVESTQKSIQFEKASILFNIAALYTQLASIFSDSTSNGFAGETLDSKLEDQLIYWLKSVGCLNYLNSNFSNSPSLDMSAYLLSFFIEVFMCQAYEVKAKLLLVVNTRHLSKYPSSGYDAKLLFVNYTNSSRIYSHVRFLFLVLVCIEKCEQKNHRLVERAIFV